MDEVAEEYIRGCGAIPSFKGYPSGFKNVQDFPATACISINDEVIHGIPSDEVILQEGDVISIDLGAYKNGFHGDAARTYIVTQTGILDIDVGVGALDNPNYKQAQKLLDVTKQSFFEGIKFAKVGYRVGDISNAIGEYVKKNGFSVVKEFQGHGVGRDLHEEPGIPNYGKPNKGIRLEPGMTLAIEPMVNVGGAEILALEDGWAIVTEDGSLSAHYENTILITEKEPEVLTIM